MFDEGLALEALSDGIGSIREVLEVLLRGFLRSLGTFLHEIGLLGRLLVTVFETN